MTEEECAGNQRWLAWQELLEAARGFETLLNDLISGDYTENWEPDALRRVQENVRATIAEVEKK